MKRFFQYFELSLVEQRGFVALILIILFILATRYIYDTFRREEDLVHDLVLLENVVEDNHRYDSVKLPTPNNNAQLFDFDPNGLSIEQWKQLGLSVKQATVIKNYEAKGGRFVKKEDLAKIYSISDKDYKRLAPYIRIGTFKTTDDNTSVSGPGSEVIHASQLVKREKKLEKSLIDIMHADSAEWVTLKGIGPVLAKRIIKYKEALGGFYDIDQIAEVYGLSPETFSQIKAQLLLKGPSVTKIRINEATLDILAKHPYISKKQAQWIVNYREQHGAYKNLENLGEIRLLNQDFFRKIEPYLEF